MWQLTTTTAQIIIIKKQTLMPNMGSKILPRRQRPFPLKYINLENKIK